MELVEYLDIVNEEDVVIGRDTRDRVHSSYAIHRGVHVFVLDSSNAILLQRRSDRVLYYPGRWDASAGGQVQSGETYLLAGARELDEELGINPESLTFISKYNSYSERQREKRALFTCRHDGPFNPDSDSIAELRFASVEEIDGLDPRMFTNGFLRSVHAWKKWLEGE